MDIRSRTSLVAAALLALSLAACGSDSNPTGTPNDTTPPGVASVTPVDAFHIDVTFTEQVTKSSAQDESNYTLVEAAVPSPVGRGLNAAPGDPVAVAGATLKGDNKTVTLATETSMAALNLDLTVHNVSDMTGNKIGEAGSGKSFTGSDTPDNTAPTVLSHAPQSGATNIAVNATVVVNFSESIKSATAQWVPGAPLMNGQNAALGVGVSFTSTIDGAKLTLTPDAPLAFSQVYTVIVSGTDTAGNAGSNTTWTFTTLANNDHTPPTLVSTIPANLATNVDVNANLSITFSEAIDSTRSEVQLVPDVGAGVATWSNGCKTVTFDPALPLLTNQQYTLTIYPDGVYDLAGNGIDGLHTVTFTTGATLNAGSIAGTITGDAGSPAADPTGATVIAADGKPFGGPFNIVGSAKVASNHSYSIPYLPNGLYYILSVLDTNHDGNLDPSDGDAIGAYGVSFPADTDPDSIAVDGGAHVTGRNFTLYDPSTASGTITYNGAWTDPATVYVALFDVAGFSLDATPVVATAAYGPDYEWSFNSIEGSFPEGDYIVAAFMDIYPADGQYEPASEPRGIYGGGLNPTVVHISNGADIRHITFEVEDVPGAPLSGAHAVTWPKAKHNVAFQRLVEIVRQGQQQASR